MRELERAIPRCESGAGCLVPHLPPGEARILELRGLIVRLGSLLGPETVVRAFGISRRELLLLASAEDAIREIGQDDTT